MRSGAITLWIAGDDHAARATELIGSSASRWRATSMGPRASRPATRAELSTVSCQLFRPTRSRGPPARRLHPAGGQVDLAPGGAVRGDGDEPVAMRRFLGRRTRGHARRAPSLGAADEETATPRGPRGGPSHGAGATGGLLDVRNSGTLMRILPGWLAGQPGGVWTIDGDESIRRRPVDRVVAPLRRWGRDRGARRPVPALTVRGVTLRGSPPRAAGGERAGQVVRLIAGCSRTAHHGRERAPAATTPSGCCAAPACRSTGGRCSPSRRSTSSSSTTSPCPATRRRPRSWWPRPAREGSRMVAERRAP